MKGLAVKTAPMGLRAAKSAYADLVLALAHTACATYT